MDFFGGGGGFCLGKGPDLRGLQVLGLASGGGQQGPLLAAAGAHVTIFDNSPAQLARDTEVAERDHLPIRTVQGDMADLSIFEDETFDLIFHPCSNCFVPNLRPVWKEAHRVLKKGGPTSFWIFKPHCPGPRSGIGKPRDLSN